MFYVYLLKSLKDNNYYIGQTQDIATRINLHNLGKVKSTRARTPLVLVGYEKYETRQESRWREYSLKKSSSEKSKFINKLVGM